MTEIVCIGEPLGELRADGHGSFALNFGGDVSNVAIAIARSGGRSKIATRLGHDRVGKGLQRLWEQEGVDTDAVIWDSTSSTGVYFIEYREHGHEFDYLRCGSAASKLSAAEVDTFGVSIASSVHVSGITQAISVSARAAVTKALQIARESKVLVSYDPNVRLQLWSLDTAREVVTATLKSVDVVLPSYDDSRLLFEVADIDALLNLYLSYGCKIVALTLGKEGVAIATPEWRERLPSLRVAAIDATGAGDTFDGAFLAEYLRTRNPLDSARFANAAAALATTKYGAVASIPTRDAIVQLL